MRKILLLIIAVAFLICPRSSFAITPQTFNGTAGNLTPTAWTVYTPTVTAQSGTFTSVSATGRYIVIGKTVHVKIVVAITTAGSASGAVIATLPVTSYNGTEILAGRETNVSGIMLQGIVNSTNMYVFGYGNSSPISSGAGLNISGTYEAQ